MVELDKETIEVMNKIKDVIGESDFEINRFIVGEAGDKRNYIEVDIRRKEHEVHN